MKIIAAVIVLVFSIPAFAMTMSGKECGMPEHAAPIQAEQEFAIIAKNYQYLPKTIVLRKGIPSRLYFTSLDRAHDIKIEGLQIRQEVMPGKAAVVEFTPQAVGTFEYICDVYCGPGHRGMKGEIIVVE